MKKRPVLNTDKLRRLIDQHRHRFDVTGDLLEIVYSLEWLLDEKEQQARLIRLSLDGHTGNSNGCVSSCPGCAAEEQLWATHMRSF